MFHFYLRYFILLCALLQTTKIHRDFDDYFFALKVMQFYLFSYFKFVYKQETCFYQQFQCESTKNNIIFCCLLHNIMHAVS